MANIAVEGAQKTALLQESDTGNLRSDPIIMRVAEAHQVSPLRQLREVLTLSLGWQKLKPRDYYAFCLFDPAMPMAEKRQYVGRGGAAALNARLSPPELTPSRAFIENKVLYTAMLRQMGLGAPDTQAVVSAEGTFGVLPVLTDASAIKQFLLNEARYPLLGKRCKGYGATGVVRIEGVEDGQARLGDGSHCALDAFCADLIANHTDGYMLQSSVLPHSDCAKICGNDTGYVRVVTVNDNGAPRPVYAVWSIPVAPNPTVVQRGTDVALAAIDLETGVVATCRSGTGLDGKEITHHPHTGAAILGTTLPLWSDVVNLAEKAHALFPEFGLCGFDIAICEDGPKVIECSENPCHQLYQHATGRGIANRDLAPVWDATASWQKVQMAQKKAHVGKRRHILV